MGKKVAFTVGTNQEQASIDFVVNPNISDDDGDPTKEPTPNSKPSTSPWAMIAPPIKGRGVLPTTKGLSTKDLPPSENSPMISEVYPGEAGKDIDMDQKIAAFQELFISFGRFDGEVNGIMSDRLAKIGLEIEREIANKIDNNSIIGTIVNSEGKLVAEAGDVKEALQLIDRHNLRKNGMKRSMDERLINFARIIDINE